MSERMSAPPSESLVWKRPANVGRAEEVKGFGGVVSPLVAGFSLAAIAQVVSSNTPPPRADWAIVAFTVTAAALLLAVQFSFLFVRHSATPEERLIWHPEARVHRATLERERIKQAKDHQIAQTYYARATICFNVGIVGFFAGLVMLVVPDGWDAAGIAAVAVAGGAGAIELLAMLRGGGLRLRRADWRSPRAVRGRVSELDEVSLAAFRGDPGWLGAAESPSCTPPAGLRDRLRTEPGQTSKS